MAQKTQSCHAKITTTSTRSLPPTSPNTWTKLAACIGPKKCLTIAIQVMAPPTQTCTEVWVWYLKQPAPEDISKAASVATLPLPLPSATMWSTHWLPWMLLSPIANTCTDTFASFLREQLPKEARILEKTTCLEMKPIQAEIDFSFSSYLITKSRCMKIQQIFLRLDKPSKKEVLG